MVLAVNLKCATEFRQGCMCMRRRKQKATYEAENLGETQKTASIFTRGLKHIETACLPHNLSKSRL